ncbi:MAG TPA: pantetheine-phosphate adenylyltransferase [Crocinitomicaceae bacterium]|nr:pantetheine-phosphate adenylyltransferase [Crocinitomicaceae bacterium]
MKKIAVFPGSFDPFTKGHESVIEKALPLFDEIYIAFGINVSKNYAFDTEKRLAHVGQLYAGNEKIKVVSYSGLTVNFCKEVNAKHIIRGLRDTKDFEYEKPIAVTNEKMAGIETVLFYTASEVAHISSTIIREIHKLGGDVSAFVTNFEVLV